MNFAFIDDSENMISNELNRHRPYSVNANTIDNLEDRQKALDKFRTILNTVHDDLENAQDSLKNVQESSQDHLKNDLEEIKNLKKIMNSYNPMEIIKEIMTYENEMDSIQKDIDSEELKLKNIRNYIKTAQNLDFINIDLEKQDLYLNSIVENIQKYTNEQQKILSKINHKNELLKYTIKIFKIYDITTLTCKICSTSISEEDFNIFECGHNCCTRCLPELKDKCHLCRRPIKLIKVYL